jgi:hypothetical protein
LDNIRGSDTYTTDITKGIYKVGSFKKLEKASLSYMYSYHEANTDVMDSFGALIMGESAETYVEERRTHNFNTM